MGAIVSIPEKETKVIGKRASLVGMDYNPKTVKECEELYRNAPQIAEVAKLAVKDGLQGKALLEAKKMKCEDEWDKPRGNMSDSARSKWDFFLETLNLLSKRKDGRIEEKTTVRELLEFAGYKERGGEIETASHYREVKKVTGSKDEKVIDKAYSDAGGKELKTAREVKEKVIEKCKLVYVRNLYEDEVGSFEDECLSTIQLQESLVENLPEVGRTEWKSFYRKLSHCIHPDKNDEGMQSILNNFDKMMTILFKQEKAVKERRDWNSDYEQWKDDRGYIDDFVREDEL